MQGRLRGAARGVRGASCGTCAAGAGRSRAAGGSDGARPLHAGAARWSAAASGRGRGTGPGGEAADGASRRGAGRPRRGHEHPERESRASLLSVCPSAHSLSESFVFFILLTEVVLKLGCFKKKKKKDQLKFPLSLGARGSMLLKHPPDDPLGPRVQRVPGRSPPRLSCPGRVPTTRCARRGGVGAAGPWVSGVNDTCSHTRRSFRVENISE